MKSFRPVLSNAIFCLNILLIFLFFFRHTLSIPFWLQPLGRMHPMVLHLPIGILILAVLMVAFRSGFKKKSFHNFLNFTLYLGAFTAALAALMGVLLSAEGGYDETQLNWHAVTGMMVSLLAWGLLMISVYASNKKTLFSGALVFTILGLILAGHFGSTLTHGEGFVWQPLHRDGEPDLVITDSTSLYAAAVLPVLRAKCATCHNEKKSKGGLVMTVAEKFIAGGEHGPVWISGDPLNSDMIKRIHLPEDNDDHMPPAGKPQLTKPEGRLIYHWILSGADFTKAWTKFDVQDSLRLLADQFIHTALKPAEVLYTFDFVAPDVLKKLNTPYATVSQFARDAPALKADFYLASGFDSKKLEDLLQAKEQVVILNLSGMPLTEKDATTVSQFTHLEKLELNKTTVDAKFLGTLKSLRFLKSVSLAGTAVDKEMANALGSMSSLKEVYVWNSSLPDEEIAALQKQFPSVSWNAGYHTNEILRLTAPIALNENMLLKPQEPVYLKNPVPGTEIRYTVDGTAPDSIKSIRYDKPIELTSYSHIRAKAYKDGWLGSAESEYYFFLQGVHPITGRLLVPPNDDYKGEGILTLMDGKKGPADAFRDVSWVGFREKPLEALFQIDAGTKIKTVTVSYNMTTGSIILPPASAELWAGEDAAHLQMIGKVLPQQPTQQEPAQIKAIVFTVPDKGYSVFKIVGQQVKACPAWVNPKPQKAWIFVDEVVFNQ